MICRTLLEILCGCRFSFIILAFLFPKDLVCKRGPNWRVQDCDLIRTSSPYLKKKTIHIQVQYNCHSLTSIVLFFFGIIVIECLYGYYLLYTWINAHDFSLLQVCSRIFHRFVGYKKWYLTLLEHLNMCILCVIFIDMSK